MGSKNIHITMWNISEWCKNIFYRILHELVFPSGDFNPYLHNNTNIKHCHCLIFFKVYPLWKSRAQYLKDGRSTNIFCSKHDFSWDKTEVSKLRYNHLHHHQKDNVTKFVVESGKRIFMIYTTKENNVNTSLKFMWPWHTYTLSHKIRSLPLWYLSSQGYKILIKYIPWSFIVEIWFYYRYFS